MVCAVCMYDVYMPCRLARFLLPVYRISELDNERRGRVSMFFCGPPAVSEILKSKCLNTDLNFVRNIFEVYS